MEMSTGDQDRVEQAADRGVAAPADMSAGGMEGDVDARLSGEDGVVHELQNVVSESDGRGNQEVIVIDGRLYDRVRNPGDRIYELEDIVERGGGADVAGGAFNGDMAEIVTRTAEKIAREMIPLIAERMIREEIEKLKREHGMG